MQTTEVAIVGAGPAGMAAAITLAQYGVEVDVFDELPRRGGQIYRQVPENFGTHAPTGAQQRKGHVLIEQAGALNISWHQSTTVWGVFQPGYRSDANAKNSDGMYGSGVDATQGLMLATHSEGGAKRTLAQRLLLATGAYDLPVGFPGWTLPGAMTVGGCQLFLKSQRLIPGKELVLAGSHPLLLIFAQQLLEAGGTIAAIALLQEPQAILRAARHVFLAVNEPGKLGELVRAFATIKRAHVPIYAGHVIAGAHGDVGVEEVTLGRYSRDRGLVSKDVRVSADAVAVGYGFLASSELARQAGCETYWDFAAGGWIIQHDEWMRSTVNAISVAGEITGVAGADVSEDEGHLAALGILVDLGKITLQQAQKRATPIRRRQRSRRRLVRMLRDFTTIDLGLLDAVRTDDTLVCRCERVSAASVGSFMDYSAPVRTSDGLKLLSRVGMGLCQGRLCSLTSAQMLASNSENDLSTVGSFKSRVPVIPVRLGDIADLDGSR